MYKTLFILGYYGLLRVGELTHGAHMLKAKDVHVGMNKEKILLVLYSSKTHGKNNLPQEIKITAAKQEKLHPSGKCLQRHFCPFELTRWYMKLRGGYSHENEEFFVFKDGSYVTPSQVRKTLRRILSNLNIEAHLYDTHSL